MNSEPACGVSRLKCPDCLIETAELTGVFDLNNGAWCIANWDDILGRTIRGRDLLVPGVNGVLARGRLRDRLDASMQMMFDGNVDQTGATHAPLDVSAGLEINRRVFIAGAVAPPATPSTFTLALTLADGTVRSGPIHCEGFRWQQVADGMARAVWQISIPAGILT